MKRKEIIIHQSATLSSRMIFRRTGSIEDLKVSAEQDSPGILILRKTIIPII